MRTIVRSIALTCVVAAVMAIAVPAVRSSSSGVRMDRTHFAVI